MNVTVTGTAISATAESGGVIFTWSTGTSTIVNAATLVSIKVNGVAMTVPSTATIAAVTGVASEYVKLADGSFALTSGTVAANKDYGTVKYVQVALPASISAASITDSSATLTPAFGNVITGTAEVNSGNLYVKADTAASVQIVVTVGGANVTTAIDISSTGCTLSNNTGLTASSGETMTITAAFSAAQTASSVASLNLTAADN